jgi:hypothetical protein
MSFDKTGLTIKRYDEILSNINARVSENLGETVDTSENSLLGHMNSNVSYSLAEVWEMGLGVYSAQNLFNAEGEGLDNQGIQSGLVRLRAKQSVGTGWFTGLDGTEITTGSEVVSLRGDTFITKGTFTISAASCISARVYIGLLVDNVDYRVGIDLILYETNSSGKDINTILSDIKTAIGTVSGYTTTFVQHATDDTQSYLSIDKTDTESPFILQASTYMNFDNVVTPALLYSEEYGIIAGDAFAINQIVTGNTNWYSVVNPSDLFLGDTVETDTEFRQRILSEFTVTGSGTIEAIQTLVGRVENVQAVVINENTTTVTDAKGVPPKSYEVVVFGGAPVDIGNAIWSTKPAGIYLHNDGSPDVEITDLNGYKQFIRYSTPAIQYIRLRITYTVNSEQDFADNAEEVAAQAMLTFADKTFSIGDDVHPHKFIGTIYESGEGWGGISIEISKSTNPLSGYGAWSSVIETIAPDEVTSYGSGVDRMIFVQV